MFLFYGCVLPTKDCFAEEVRFFFSIGHPIEKFQSPNHLAQEILTFYTLVNIYFCVLPSEVYSVYAHHHRQIGTVLLPTPPSVISMCYITCPNEFDIVKCRYY
jgi:hypothetical protein